MIIGTICVHGVRALPVSVKPIPRGIIGAKVQFEYADPMWDGLSKTVVFRAGDVTKDVLNAGELVKIPPEVITEVGEILKVGVYGEGIPTLWADLGRVRDATDPSGDESTDPSLPVWAQLQNQIDDLRENGSPGGGGGSGENGGYYTPSVKQPDSDTLQFNFAPSKANMPAINPVEVELPAGPKGDDYKLTDADKKEIAEMAAGLVEIPDSGGNADYVGVEPAYEDIPKIFFGGALQQTKDEKVVPFRYISKTDDFSGYAEIKAQGNSSMGYAKKNQTVKMFKDADCTEKMKVDFKGWGKQNKHCYKANWIDLTHARNIVSARLWADVVQSRVNYAELPELLRTSPNQGAVDGFPVKVYAAGVYQGRYTINIPKDKWMANMDDELDTHCILCGEGYNSGCFRSASTADWTDEIHDSMPTTIKNRWIEVINFVMNSTDDEFKANLGNYFDVQSLIDYHLYGLLSCGLDAYGKNQLYLTYDGQKWIASMYDMDSTWGLYWNGKSFVATDYARTSYEDFVDGRQGNLLYIRLEQLLGSELQTRWAELKNGALSIENIINRFERFTDITPVELVKEDYASTTGGGKFTGIPSQTTNNIQQIRAFALARQAWTDEYISALSGESGGEEEPDEPNVPETVPCTGITLDKTELAFDGIGTQTITAMVTPSDTTDSVVWISSAPAVASITVEGTICTVQSVSNGSAEIIVTCGSQSERCYVSVANVNGDDSAFETDTVYTVQLTPGITIESDGTIIQYSGESANETYFTIPDDAGYIKFTAPGGANVCFYDSDKTLIGNRHMATMQANNYVFMKEIPNGAAFLRVGVRSRVSETRFMFASFEHVGSWEKSGNDYVTGFKTIPNGATSIGISDIGTATFDYLKIWIFDSSESQLTRVETNRGGYSVQIALNNYPTATYYKLSAHPNAETDNNPATQIGIMHNIIET